MDPACLHSRFCPQTTSSAKTESDSNAEKLVSVAERLSALVDEFTATASQVGQQIISELHLPREQRTIKPIDAGGIAGGEKSIAKGIFFKLAVDLHALYGGDRYAAKVASRELIGLMNLQNVSLFYDVKGVHFPLMAIITYRGHRCGCMASSLLAGLACILMTSLAPVCEV